MRYYLFDSGLSFKTKSIEDYWNNFLSDGITSVKDLVLFTNQSDENGNYELMTHLKKR